MFNALKMGLQNLAGNAPTNLLSTGLQYFSNRSLMKRQDELNSIGHKMEQYSDAGVNPMFAVDNPVGSTGLGQVSAPSTQNYAQLKQEYKLRSRELDIAETNAEANKMEAEAAKQNADTNAGNLGVSQFNAETQRMIAESQILKNESEIKQFDANVKLIAEKIETEDLQQIYQQYVNDNEQDILNLTKEDMVAGIALKYANSSKATSEKELNDQLYNINKPTENFRGTKLAQNVEGAKQAVGLIGGVFGAALSGSGIAKIFK